MAVASGIVSEARFLALNPPKTPASSSAAMIPPAADAATTVAALPLDVVVLLLLSEVNDEFIRISSNSLPNNSFSVNSPKLFVSPKGLKATMEDDVEDKPAEF